MSTSRHSEAAFETVVETHLLRNGYGSVPLFALARLGQRNRLRRWDR